MMDTPTAISRHAAVEVIRLIEEYLYQGGTGRDENALFEALHALETADAIEIIEGSDWYYVESGEEAE